MLTLPGRANAPGATPYRPLTPGNLAPLTTNTNAPVRTQPRAFNLDTAVGRILADLKYVGLVGEFELAVTNGAKVEVTSFPLVVHLLEGQVRTEIDISPAPALITATGPFSSLRQFGVTRLVSLTYFNAHSQIFPEGKCYVSRELEPEEILAMIRLERRVVGQEVLNGIACEKTLLTMIYHSGEKREARLWAVGGNPRQIQFDVGDSRLTIRVSDAQSAAELRQEDILKQKAELFDMPKDYLKFNRLDDILTRFHAIQQRTPR
ncbi:MAG: hypothetical protein ACKODH_05240 [Limisphaerales bacterium]